MYRSTKRQAESAQPDAEPSIPANQLQLLLDGDLAVFSELFDVPILWRLNRAFVPDSGTVLVVIRNAVQKLISAAATTELTLTMSDVLGLLNHEVGSAIREGRDKSRRRELPQFPHLVGLVLRSLSPRGLDATARSYRCGGSSEAIYRGMGIGACEFRAIRGRLGSSYAQDHPPQTFSDSVSEEVFDTEGELMNAYQALNVLRSPSPVVRKAKADLRKAMAQLAAEALISRVR